MRLINCKAILYNFGNTDKKKPQLFCGVYSSYRGNISLPK